MSEQQEEQVITFKEQNYNVSDLSEKAKYFVSQLQDLQQQGNGNRAKLDQITVATKGFEDLLEAELAAETEE
jgi:hypothetical protein